MLNVHWRPATAEDMPKLESIQHAMNTRLGEDYDLPEISEERPKAIMLAMVAEHEGKIIGMAYVEMVPELKFCSDDPRFSAAVRRDLWPEIVANSRKQGIRFIQMPVPEKADKRIAKALKHKRVGMRESNCRFFIKDLV